MRDCRFDIDFFEFSFLVEACITPAPIARATFFEKVINDYYHELSQNERGSLYEWMGRNSRFQDGLEKEDDLCVWFERRYSPDNQFKVTAKYDGEETTHETFKHKDKYYLKIDKWVADKYIIDVEKL